MEALFESIRVEEYGNAVVVYNSLLHSQRIFNSAQELDFQSVIARSHDVALAKSSDEAIHTSGIEMNQLLFFQNQIKNFLQYHFNKAVSFKENLVSEPFKESPTHKVYKLRFMYFENAEIKINIEEYDRDLKQEWKVRVINPNEFHVNTQDLAFRHKLYNRERIPVSADWQEQIWLNEKGEVCEGSFTNIFWQDQHGNWFTPDLSCNILPGVARSLLIKKLNAQEVKHTVYDLQQAKQVILSNAMIGAKKVILRS